MRFQNTENETSTRAAHHSTHCLRLFELQKPSFLPILLPRRYKLGHPTNPNPNPNPKPAVWLAACHLWRVKRAGHVTWRRVWRVWLNSLGTRDFRNRKSDPLARSGKVYKKIAQ